jgi:hypothetical protein
MTDPEKLGIAGIDAMAASHSDFAGDLRAGGLFRHCERSEAIHGCR